MTALRCLFAALLLWGSPALADITVSYKVPTGTIQLEENARGALRVSFGPESYVLFSEGRAYLAQRKGKRVDVTDLTTRARTFGPTVGRFARFGTGLGGAGTKIVPLDGGVTVAGVAGQRYEIRAEGIPGPLTLVAATTPDVADVRRLTERLLDQLAELARAAGPEVVAAFVPELERLKTLQRDHGAILKLGDYLELTGVSQADIPPERFSLAGLPDNARSDPRIAGIIERAKP
ncbi:MAG: hypothetical protein INF91_10595 [Alphaproteobacteria bacterium]|nr:hypothetical protein [Alphaproteobacteria bacterium]